MVKANAGGRKKNPPRRFDGFVWLARHSRRAEIVAYVTGLRPAAEWMRDDRCWPKIDRDRRVHVGFTSGLSMRQAGMAVGISCQMVANILAAYAEPPGAVPDREPLKLKPLAKRAITRDVIRRFDAGEINTADVAALIGGGADHRNVTYWLDRMRGIYERLDAGKR